MVEVKSEYYLKNKLNAYKFKYAKDYCESVGINFMVFIQGVNESEVIESVKFESSTLIPYLDYEYNNLILK